MTDSLYEELRKDHHRGEASLTTLEETAREEDRLNQVFDVQNQLIPHMLAEERAVLSQLKIPTGELSPEAIRREHDQIRLRLQELAETPVNDRLFGSRSQALSDLWRHHVEQEERFFLPRLDDLFGDRAADILTRYRTERTNLTRSGPQASHNWR